MPRNKSLLNVRRLLEVWSELADHMLKENAKARDGGVRLPPLFAEELPKMIFLTKAALRKADNRRKAGNRKDIYIEAS